jgi:hypothetical protein
MMKKFNRLVFTNCSFKSSLLARLSREGGGVTEGEGEGEGEEGKGWRALPSFSFPPAISPSPLPWSKL